MYILRIFNQSHLKSLKGLATKLGAIPVSLTASRCDDVAVRLAAKETLTRLGVVHPLPMKGIRILSIDGGGMKGFIALEVLRRMEAESGKRIHEVNTRQDELYYMKIE